MVLKARISWDDSRGSPRVSVLSKTVANALYSLSLSQGPSGMHTFSTNTSRRKTSASLASALKALS
eukprot:12046131-Alexandrium_andersonii.AAC.1